MRKRHWRILIVCGLVIIASAAALIGVSYVIVDARLREGSIAIVPPPPEPLFPLPVIRIPIVEEIPYYELYCDEPDLFDLDFLDLDLREFFLNEEAEISEYENEGHETEGHQYRDYEYRHEQDDYIFERVEIADRIFNVLILGDDARAHETRGRSDAIILASFNRDTNEVSFTTFARDMLVPMNRNGDNWNRINVLHRIGGPGRAINMINYLFSLDIQRYVVLRFSSVITLTDIFGGLELSLTAAEANRLNNIFTSREEPFELIYEPLTEGPNLLNGRQVLAYSRLRAIGGDFARGVRQRYVMQALTEQAMTTRNFREIMSLAGFALNHTETNIPLSEILSIAFEAFTQGMPQMREMQLPVTGSFRFARHNENSVLVFDFEQNITALHYFVFGCTENIVMPNIREQY